MPNGTQPIVGNAVSNKIPSSVGSLLSPLSGEKQNMGLFGPKAWGFWSVGVA